MKNKIKTDNSKHIFNVFAVPCDKPFIISYEESIKIKEGKCSSSVDEKLAEIFEKNNLNHGEFVLKKSIKSGTK